VKQDRDFFTLINEFLEQRREQHYSEQTLTGNKQVLNQFRKWCKEHTIHYPGKVTQKHIYGYRSYLTFYRKKDGNPLKERTKAHILSALKVFYTWMTKNHFILSDPTSSLIVKRSFHQLPGNILTPKEIARIFEQPDLSTRVGVRDRSILELLYDTGTRCREAVNLTLPDLRFQTSTLFIHRGKGNKDRLVPLGSEARRWLQLYLMDSRPSLVCGYDNNILFLTSRGAPLRPQYLTRLVRQYMRAAKITKKGACHLFRHAMATGMLENGADIRHIQAILGHEKLSTTQIYTKVAIKGLKKVHSQTHPFERESK